MVQERDRRNNGKISYFPQAARGLPVVSASVTSQLLNDDSCVRFIVNYDKLLNFATFAFHRFHPLMVFLTKKRTRLSSFTKTAVIMEPGEALRQD